MRREPYICVTHNTITNAQTISYTCMSMTYKIFIMCGDRTNYKLLILPLPCSVDKNNKNIKIKQLFRISLAKKTQICLDHLCKKKTIKTSKIIYKIITSFIECFYFIFMHFIYLVGRVFRHFIRHKEEQYLHFELKC